MDDQLTERRITNKLCAYWNSLRGTTRNHPSKDDIVADDIITIWPYCFIIDIHMENESPNYQLVYLGKAIQEAFENDLGLDLEGPLFSPDLESIREYLDEVVENKQPVMYEAETSTTNDETLKYRQCFLPLGKKDNSVDAVIGVFSFKRY